MIGVNGVGVTDAKIGFHVAGGAASKSHGQNHWGGAGDDIIKGGRGDDVITGGAGDDRMEGGEGADTFMFDTESGHDIITDYRQTRSLIGLVPQELTTEVFETVWATVNFSRGLFGKKSDPGHIEKVLKELSLWDKKDSMITELSGGMKRRLLIAKALSHEPNILFLDEPTAGVDVELRKEMWQMVRALQASGVTIILPTHYIEEAEAIAERVGVINNGEIVVVEDKAELMNKMGKKQLTLYLHQPLQTIPPHLQPYNLELADGGARLVYTYDTHAERTGITALLAALNEAGIKFRDLQTTQSSLEDMFVKLGQGAA